MMFYVFNDTFIVATCNNQSRWLLKTRAGSYSERDVFFSLVSIQTGDNDIAFLRHKPKQVSDALFLFKLAEVKSWVQNIGCAVFAELLNQLERLLVNSLGVLAVDYGHSSQRCCNFFDQIKPESVEPHAKICSIHTE